MAQKLSLQQHLDLLGLDARLLSFRGIERQAIDRALAGEPISHAVAVKICRELNRLHDLDPKVGTLQPEDLQGLQTWKHEATKEDYMQRSDYQPGMLTPEQQQRIWRDITPDGQVERCAKAVTIQRAAEDIVGGILRYNQSTEGIQRAQRAQQEIERKQRQQVAARKTVYGSAGHPGMITRSYSREEQARRFIAEQQANLRRDNERMAELRRQVQRERAGYR